MRSENMELTFSGITLYAPVRVRVRCGRIVSIETISPKGPWSIMDYADLPDVSGLRVGDTAPSEIIARARLWERFSATMRNHR